MADNLAGGYLSTAESKIAPLLVSGSWVGWLMDELNKMLPARFRYKYLKNMPGIQRGVEKGIACSEDEKWLESGK